MVKFLKVSVQFIYPFLGVFYKPFSLWMMFSPTSLRIRLNGLLSPFTICQCLGHLEIPKYWFLRPLPLSVDIVIGGLITGPKNSKKPFFSRFSKSLLISHWNWSKDAPVFLLFQKSQQMWSLELFKVLADISCGWQPDWATAKIFLSI